MTTTTYTSTDGRTPFGWCLTGHHEGGEHQHSKPCPGRISGKRCPCSCHGPAPEHESVDESVREQETKVTAPVGRYTARERADGTWVVVGPDGQTEARISGRTSWLTEGDALKAERNGNRRKSVRGAAT